MFSRQLKLFFLRIIFLEMDQKVKLFLAIEESPRFVYFFFFFFLFFSMGFLGD